MMESRRGMIRGLGLSLTVYVYPLRVQGMEPIPAYIGQEEEYALDRSPVHHRADIQRQSDSQPLAILKALIKQSCKSLDCGRKLEYVEKIHTESRTFLLWRKKSNHCNIVLSQKSIHAKLPLLSFKLKTHVYTVQYIRPIRIWPQLLSWPSAG